MATRVEVSVKSIIQNTIKAMENVSSAALGGSPGGSTTITGKKVTAQVSFKLRDLGMKKDIQSAAQQKLTEEVFTKQATSLESEIKDAMEQVVQNIVGYTNNSIRVFGVSVGELKSSSNLDDEGFAKFIKSPQGAGEVGLPDPIESLHQLKLALIASITVDVIVRPKGPQVKLKFNQRNLLKLTPHPDQFEQGQKGPFFSWLSLVTGPDFASGGTPGYSLVRLANIKAQMGSNKSVQGLTSSKTRQGLKRITFFENVMRISRTAGYAGDYAAVMLSTRVKPPAKLSSAQYFGGQNEEYRPSKVFSGFWDKWWLQRKIELTEHARKIMVTAIKALIKG
jgi:hypothetical protein